MSDTYTFIINRDQAEKLAESFRHDLDWNNSSNLDEDDRGRVLISDDIKFFNSNPERTIPVIANTRLMIIEPEFQAEQRGLIAILDEAEIEYTRSY